MALVVLCSSTTGSSKNQADVVTAKAEGIFEHGNSVRIVLLEVSPVLTCHRYVYAWIEGIGVDALRQDPSLRACIPKMASTDPAAPKR